MQSEYQNYLQEAIGAAEEGGEILRLYWGKVKDIREKGGVGNLVTEADQQSEEKILKRLQNKFPKHNFLAEESGLHKKEKKEFLWAIDPLDGTTNYAHQFPFVAVSIALLFRGEPIVGVVYDPIRKEMFTAIKGMGAKLNGSFIFVTKTRDIPHCLLATGFAYDRQNKRDNNLKEFAKLTLMCQGVRRAGAAALDLAYVAAGRLDGFWEKGLEVWDMAAGALLVTEAQGVVTDYTGALFDVGAKEILATNGLIHSQVSQILTHRETF